MNPERDNPPAIRTRGSGVALALLVLLYGLALARSVPPPVVPVGAPADAFSAERALAHLERIEGQGRPHPIGSAENARVRELVSNAFRELGIEARSDERLVRGPWNVVGVVRNVVARIPGTHSTRSVLVCAHHDSVPAGPGTSDDGAGVAAALEIARALRQGPAPANDVVFLIDDGEEAGLLGARAFLAHDPLARDVGVVVNLEARGTSGRAHMFETSAGNGELIDALASGAPRPSATSVAHELYEAMPNDTNLTVFKEAGLAGLNFAFIGGVARYHTPRDDLAHLDPRSLQHLGESGLGVVRELAHRDLRAQGGHDALYADVLGLFLLRFDARWALPLAIAAFLGSAWNARRTRLGALAFASLALSAGLVAALLGSLAISSAIQAAHGAALPWSAHPAWSRVAVLLGSCALGAWAVRLAARRSADGEALRAASFAAYGLLGIAAALFVPSASYLFTFPLLAALPAAVLGARGRALGTWVALVTAGVFTLPVLIGIEDGFGHGAPPGLPLVPVGGVVALLVVLAADGLARGRALALAAATLAAGIALVLALFLPPFDADSPGWLNFVHEEDATSGTARWIAVPVQSRLPAEVAAVLPFEARENAFVNSAYSGARAGCVAPAVWHGTPAPRLEPLEQRAAEGARIVRARLAPARQSHRLSLRFPDSVRVLGAIWEGERLDLASSGLRSLRVVGLGGEGLELELRIEGHEPVEIELAEVSSLVPAETLQLPPLVVARPGDRVPRGEGDVSVVTARVRL